MPPDNFFRAVNRHYFGYIKRRIAMKRSIHAKISAFLSSAVIMFTVSSARTVSAAEAVWVKSDKGYSYKDETGKYLKGWQEINGNTYYFDEEGFTVTGWKRLDRNKDLHFRRYYFLTSQKGKMAKGWVKIGEDKYYFDPATGVVCTGPVKIKGVMYCFDKDGRMLKDCGLRLNNKTYIMDENGVVTNQAEIEDVLIELDDPMENLDWGMTEKEIAKALGIEDYVVSGSQMALPKAYPTAEQVTYYISEENGLQSYSISRGRDEGNPPGQYSSRARGRININGWHKGTLTDKIEHIAVYSKNRQLLIFINDDTSVITMVVSPELSQKFFNREKDFKEVFKEALGG